MPFLIQGKTNWKYILIVLILAIIVGGGIFFWIKTQEIPPAEFPEIKKPEKVVEKESPLTVEKKEIERIIAFDVSHDNRGKNYSKFLNGFKESGFEIELITDKIDENNLKKVGTLILTVHFSSYLQSELEAIKKFLEKGGNLIILGDFVGLDDINRIISPLGVELFDCNLGWGWEVVPVFEHVLLKDVEKLSFPAATCLKIKNEDFKAIVHAPEWPVVAVKENKNKILISGDSNVCDDEYINRAHNRVFCKNITLWLKEAPLEKEETTNWKIYRNEKYGFEFKYPPIPSGCENCKIHESEEGFTVNTTNLSIEDLGELTLSEFVDKKMKEFEIERKEKILIGGKEGIKVDYRFGGMGRFGSAAFVEKNKKVIIFEFTAGGFCCGPGVDRIYEYDVYDAMLSTFRFLK